MSKVWLVTGSGSGLGRDIVEAVLAAGERVVATARRLELLHDVLQTYRDRARGFQLDVSDESAAQAAVRFAVKEFGRLDVLVNNAGFGLFAPFEQIPSQEFKAVMDTNFYGTVYTTRAAVPIMREQGRGWILQVSSIGGRITIPCNSPYHAAKWAVGGFSDSLGAELGPLGIKVCTLEPGGIRTNWATRARLETPKLLPEYEPILRPLLNYFEAMAGHEEGDPQKIAKVVLKLTQHESLPRRLVLGVDAENRLQQWESARHADAEEWQQVTRSTVYEERLRPPHLSTE